MKGDVLVHAVEVKEYKRVLPSGRVITVKAYSRNGNAAEDDRARRADLAYKHYSGAVDAAKYNLDQWRKNPEAFQKMKTTPVYSEWQSTGRPGEKTRRVIGEKTESTPISATEAYAPYDKAVADREAAVQREMEREATTGDKLKYSAIDVKEEVEVAVNNAVQEISAGAQAVGDIVSGATEKVVEAVRSGWNAVKSFFGGLFGRR